MSGQSSGEVIVFMTKEKSYRFHDQRKEVIRRSRKELKKERSIKKTAAFAFEVIKSFYFCTLDFRPRM